MNITAATPKSRVTRRISDARLLIEHYGDYTQNAILLTFDDGTEFMVLVGALKAFLPSEDQVRLGEDFSRVLDGEVQARLKADLLSDTIPGSLCENPGPLHDL